MVPYFGYTQNGLTDSHSIAVLSLPPFDTILNYLPAHSNIQAMSHVAAFSKNLTTDLIWIVAGWVGAYVIYKISRKALQHYMGIRPDKEDLEAMQIFAEHFDEILDGKYGRLDTFPFFKPILYLQGWVREGDGMVKVDGVWMRIQFFLKTAFEMNLHQIVGIGGKATEEVVKLTRTDENWRCAFSQLAMLSNVIFLRPFVSESVKDELKYLLAHYPHKIILIMDPIDTDFSGSVSRTETKESQIEYNGKTYSSHSIWQLTQEVAAEFVELPDYQDSGGFVFLENSAAGELVAHRMRFYKKAIANRVRKMGGFAIKHAKIRFPKNQQFDESEYHFPVFFDSFTKKQMLEQVNAHFGRNDAEFLGWLDNETALSAY